MESEEILSSSSNSSSSRKMSSPSINMNSEVRVISESKRDDERDGGMSKNEMMQANNGQI